MYRKIVLATLVLFATALAGCAAEDTSADTETTTSIETTTPIETTTSVDSTTTDTPTQTTTQSTTQSTTAQPTTEEADAQASGVADVAFGETVELANGMKITVDNVRFLDSYDDGYGETTPMKGDDYKFMLVDVTVEHTGDKSDFAPLAFDMPALANGGQYDADIYYGDEYETYEGGQLQPGVTRSGIVIYEVKDDVEAEDVAIHWTDEYYFLNSGVDLSWSSK